MKNLGYKSDIGKVRTVNQDSYLVMSQKNAKIIAVADGLGGHNAGEVASNMIVNRIEEIFLKEEFIDEVDETKVAEHIKLINTEIFQRGNENLDLNKMGTTLSLVIVIEDSMYIFHIGDSRVYIVNEKEMLQLTKDHSLVEQLVMQGEISREEARTHPNKNVLTRAIGTDEEVEVDFYKYSLNPFDRVLLCTDGLTNLVSLEEIKNIIIKNTCKDAVDVLVDKAKEYGGFDNITVIVYEPEVSQ